jgi:hypothetical protein
MFPSRFTRLHLKLRSKKCCALWPFSPKAPTVGCVLCVFVVKNPFSVAVLHRALWVSFIPHRSHRVAARKSTTPCLSSACYSTDVRYQYGPFSTLHASPFPVGCFPLHDMHIFDVMKCTYLYRQPPSSPLHHPTQDTSNVGFSRHPLSLLPSLIPSPSYFFLLTFSFPPSRPILSAGKDKHLPDSLAGANPILGGET